MRKIRLIARLDVKGSNLIKGIHLEGLRVIGDPYAHARTYYEQGVDELLYIDAVASLYGRNNLTDIVEHTARDVFVPLTVGGGIRSVEDVKQLLRCGADKVAVNTAAVLRPELISEIAERFGKQCVVLSVEAKCAERGRWEVYTENGRQPTGIDVVEWTARAAALGAGEVLLTSIDREGTRRGFDVELVRAVTREISVPVIASGGMGTIQHLVEVVEIGGADAVAIADTIHYKRKSLTDIRAEAIAAGLTLDP